MCSWGHPVRRRVRRHAPRHGCAGTLKLGKLFGQQIVLGLVQLGNQHAPPQEDGGGPRRYITNNPCRQRAQAGAGERLRWQREVTADQEAGETAPRLRPGDAAGRAGVLGEDQPRAFWAGGLRALLALGGLVVI